MIFCLLFVAFLFGVLLITRFFVPSFSHSTFSFLMLGSFLFYAIPFPQPRFLGVELPEKNILDTVARVSYDISLESYRSISEDQTQKLLPFSQQELESLVKKKQFWFEMAKEQPEKIFQTFKHSSLKKSTDEYGNSYVFEVLSAAIQEEPELAFRYLDLLEEWREAERGVVIKPLLQLAIKKNPELAFQYLSKYQHLVE